jgi:hypothetical protein
MEELRDIEGLDAISYWPLASGWWIIIGLIVVMIAVLIYLFYKRYNYRKSWQYASYKNLQQIETQLLTEDKDTKQLLHKLSVEIRRIAMTTAERESCAGLAGKQWLQWLQAHDPRNYDWPSQGQVLIEYQYMPDAGTKDTLHIKSLIIAAKRWVSKC